VTPTTEAAAPAPQALLFARDDDLYRADADSGRVERLTEGGLLGWGMAAGDEWWINALTLVPRVSPDGRQVAFSPDGNSVVVIDVQNPATAPLTLPGSAVLAWSADSRRLAAASHAGDVQRAQVVVYNLDTGAATPLLGELVADIATLVWSPDGQRVAFGCCFADDSGANGEYLGTSTGQVTIVDLDSRQVERVGELSRSVAGGVEALCWTADNRLAGYEGGQPDGNHCSTPPDLSVSPDGQRRFTVVGPPQPAADSVNQLVVEELATGETWQRPLEGDLWPIAWSPDGQFILLDDSGAATPIWRLVASGTGEIEVLIDDGRLLPTTIQPAPTGALLFYHSDGHLYTVPLGGGQSRRLTTQPLAGANEPFIVDGMFGFHPPVVSPNGRLLALNGNWGGASVLDLVTGEFIGIGRGQAMQSPSWSPDSRQLAYVTPDDRLCIYNLNGEPDDCPFAPEGLLMEAIWSPTGALIATAVVTPPVEGSSDCCDGRVWLVDPTTGAAADVAGFVTGFEYAPGEAFQWLADGSGLAIKRTGDSGGSAIYRPGDGSVVAFDEWIAGVAPDGGTVLHPSGAVSAADGTVLAPLPGAGECAEFVNVTHVWSPDGRLAYALWCGFDYPPVGPNVLTVIDPATGVAGWQRELPVGLFPVGWSPDGQFILLDDAAYGSPIWRLAADGTGEPEVVVEDGRLLELVPAKE
jgi:Tol biopolymer transport system component